MESSSGNDKLKQKGRIVFSRGKQMLELSNKKGENILFAYFVDYNIS